MTNQYETVYEQALFDAAAMWEAYPGLEIRSGLKQAASDRGIPYGDEMQRFVDWAERRIFDGY